MTTIKLTQSQIDKVLAEHCDHTRPPIDPPIPPDPPSDVDPLKPVPRPSGLPTSVYYYSCSSYFGKELAVSNSLDQGTRDRQVGSDKLMVGIAIPELDREKTLLVTQRSTGTGPYDAVLSTKPDMETNGSLKSGRFGAGSLGCEMPPGAARIVYFSLDADVSPIRINLQIMLR